MRDTKPDTGERIKLPTTVRIGPHDYTIKQWGKMAADNDGSLGLCDKTTSTILVADYLSDQKACEVLIHECLHACYDVAGLHYGPGKGDATVEEERLVNGLAYAVTGVLRDNPQLLAYVAKVYNHKVPR